MKYPRLDVSQDNVSNSNMSNRMSKHLQKKRVTIKDGDESVLAVKSVYKS